MESTQSRRNSTTTIGVDVAITRSAHLFSAEGVMGATPLKLRGRRKYFSKRWKIEGEVGDGHVEIELCAHSRLHHGGTVTGRWGSETVDLDAQLERIEGRIQGRFGSSELELFPKRRIQGVIAVAGPRASGLELSVGREGPTMQGESPTHREAAGLLLALPCLWRGGAETTAWAYYLEPLHKVQF